MSRDAAPCLFAGCGPAVFPNELSLRAYLPVTRIPRKPLSAIDLSTFGSFVLSTEQQQHLDRGVALFNSRRFWEAHEVWEEVWKVRPEDGRFLIQGMIQLAAAYHQLVRGVHRGFLIHLRQAEERLKLFPPHALGVDIAALLKTVQDSLNSVENCSDRQVNWATLPVAQITLVEG